MTVAPSHIPRPNMAKLSSSTHASPAVGAELPVHQPQGALISGGWGFLARGADLGRGGWKRPMAHESSLIRPIPGRAGGRKDNTGASPRVPWGGPEGLRPQVSGAVDTV